MSSEYAERCWALAGLLGIPDQLSDTPRFLMDACSQVKKTMPADKAERFDVLFAKYISYDRLVEGFRPNFESSAVGPGSIDELETFFGGPRGAEISTRLAAVLRYDALPQAIEEGKHKIDQLTSEDPLRLQVLSEFAQGHPLIESVSTLHLHGAMTVQLAFYEAQSNIPGEPASFEMAGDLRAFLETTHHTQAAIAVAALSDVPMSQLAGFLSFMVSEIGRHFFWSLSVAFGYSGLLTDMAYELMTGREFDEDEVVH